MSIGIAGCSSTVTAGVLDAALDCALCNPFHRVMVAFVEHRVNLDYGLSIHDALQGLMLTSAHVETVAHGRTSAKGRERKSGHRPKPDLRRSPWKRNQRMTDKGGAQTCLSFSPCGRRWREAPDEGSKALSERPLRPLTRPARRATLSRKGRGEGRTGVGIGNSNPSATWIFGVRF